MQGAERVTSGTTGNKCAEINKYGIGKPSLHLGSSLGAGCHRPRQVRTRYTHSLLWVAFWDNSDSNVTPVKDDAFSKLQVKLPNANHLSPVLKVKLDTGAQENILPLPIYRNMFLHHVDESGLPTETAPSQTKLTACSVAQIPQHGVCSIKCSCGDKATDAVFYAADVAGSAICGLPTCCQLNLVELHCAVGTCSSKVPLPAVKDSSKRRPCVANKIK